MRRTVFAFATLCLAIGLFPSPAPQTAPVHATPQIETTVRAVVKYAEAQPGAQPAPQVKPIGQQPPQPAPAPKPPLLTVPDEVHVQPGTLSQILIQTEAGVTLHYQFIGPKSANVFREYDPDPAHVSFQCLGTTPGTFYLMVFALKDGQVSKASCTIVIDPPPGPAPQPAPTPPTPGPTPPAPPVPADPLVAQLQALYTADVSSVAEKLPVKNALAGLYANMAAQLGAGQYATVAEASKALKDQAQAAPLGTYLLPLRRACAAEVSNAVGPAPAAKLNPALRGKLVSTFTRLAAALNAIK